MVAIAADAVVWSAEPDPARPLMLLLHGYGSDERDLASLVPYLPPDAVYASLRAPLPGPGDFGFAWYPLNDLAPDAPLSSIDPDGVRDATDAILAWLGHAAPASRTFAAIGFSQGGSMALELLRAAPERCLTVANLAGFIARPAEPGEADRMLQRRVFWGYGDADPVIPPSWIAATRAFLDAHTRCSEIRYPGLGHSISAAELDDLTLFWRRTVARADTV